jgi:hypothetical protein
VAAKPLDKFDANGLPVARSRVRASGCGLSSASRTNMHVRHMVAGADGDNLYPAMPFDAFTLITEDNLKALWAYPAQGRSERACPGGERCALKWLA